MNKANIETNGKEEEVVQTEEESLKKEAEEEEVAQGMEKREEETAQEEKAAQEPSKKLSARVLKIHQVPKHKFDWVDLWLPQSKLNRRAYSQRIDLVEETTLYLVAFLGRGGNGDVWFGITPDGERCCAVKFFFPQKYKTTAQLAQEECDKWNDVYGNDKNHLPACHVGHLCDKTAYLCMPYVAPAPKRIWPMIVDPIFGAQDVEKALWKFAHAGYKQESLRLEHLGFFPVANTKASLKDPEEEKVEDEKSQEATGDAKDQSCGSAKDDEDGKEVDDKSHSTTMDEDAKDESRGETDDESDEDEDDEDNEDQTLELYLFDLGRLVKFGEDEDKEAWVQSSIQTLQAALPPLSVCNSMPWGHEGSFYEHLYSGY